MNPITARFSSVEALRASDVDVKALKASGQIEVGGKHYQIRSAADGGFDVKRSEQHANFFKTAGSVLGVKSKGDQIAQVLNEKLSATPRLLRLGKTTLGPTFNIEEGQSSSAVGRVQGTGLPPGKEVKSSIARWAAKAEKLATRDEDSIYKIYYKDAPVTRMPEEAHRPCLNHFKKLNGRHGVDVWPQRLDGMSKKDRALMTATVIDENPRASREFFKIQRFNTSFDESEIKARLTVNIKPEYAKELASAAAKLTGKQSEIIMSKIAGPALIGTQTDTAVFYMRGDFAATEALAQKLKAMLPPDALIDQPPMGTHSIAPGLYYAERTPTDNTSHGRSRAAIILSALDDPSRSSLQEKLNKAFEAHGYNPENPAFRL